MLYFKYNVCEDDPAHPFASFSASILATLDSQPVDMIVFDFRGNTGGDSAVITLTSACRECPPDIKAASVRVALRKN
jgi:hypothetical protein